MRTRSLFALALLLILVGCDAAAPVPAPPQVLPLAVGTEWTLAAAATVEYDRQTGVATDTLRPPAGPLQTVTLTVTRDTVVGGERWFQIEPSRGFSHCVFRPASWFANREDGLYRFQGTAAEAERVYALGDVGEAFIDGPTVRAVLAGRDEERDLSGELVATRRYERTFRRVELADVAQGPVEPTQRIDELLSSSEGPLALEVGYVAAGRVEGTFVPFRLIRFEIERSSRAGAVAASVPEIAIPLR